MGKIEKFLDPAFEEGRLAYSNGVTAAENPYRAFDAEQGLVWDSGWEHARKTREAFLGHGKPPSDPSDFSSRIAGGFAKGVGVVTFCVCWIYAVVAYGWFVGLAFGWIPSLIIAIFATLLSPVIGVLLLGISLLAGMVFLWLVFSK